MQGCPDCLTVGFMCITELYLLVMACAYKVFFFSFDLTLPSPMVRLQNVSFYWSAV